MKSTDRILAKRYAKAYDLLSSTNEQAAQSYAALLGASESLEVAKTYMQDPAVSTAEKINFVKELFGTQQQVVRFLTILLQSKRYYLLTSCVQEVSQLLDKRQGVLRAQVESAFELSEETKRKVEETLSRFTGQKTLAQFKTDPALLGGLRARMGDVLIDGSLKGRFEKLQEQLTK